MLVCRPGNMLAVAKAMVLQGFGWLPSPVVSSPEVET